MRASLLIRTALCAGLLAVLGCSEDEGEAGGGTGGSGATGGSAGSAGTAGVGSSGGSAGEAGQAGSAGSAGTAGSAGNAGSGGIAGSAGQGSGGVAGAAGSSSGACNYLTQLAPAVTAYPSAAQAPLAQGGDWVEGFYTLSSVNLYGGASGTTFWRTIRLVGNEYKIVRRDGTQANDSTSVSTYVKNGTQLNLTDTCPAPKNHSIGFSASGSSFTAYEDQGGGKLVELKYDYYGAMP